jgi:citrate synthase
MTNIVRTTLWHEEPEPNDPFATRTARCRGYNVFGDLVGSAGWAEMLLLLWRGERPDAGSVRLLDALAVALANAGPRDAAVHAAMCGAVGGSPAAACLMAALAVGAGQHGGAQDVARALHWWQVHGLDLAAWQRALTVPAAEVESIWPRIERAPGFDAHARCCAGITVQALAALARLGGDRLAWLDAQRAALEMAAGAPLAMSGVAAAALADLGLSPEAGEMLYLLLRLPGAAAHALEQRLAFKRFPFFQHGIEADDAAQPT